MHVTTKIEVLRRTNTVFIFFFFLCSLPFASCQKSLTSNSQDQPVDWQEEGKYRGTWGIVSNCLATIFACTWSIQHLNIPGPRASDGSWSRFKRSSKWMIITILFPEFMVLHAFIELKMATKALQIMMETDNKSVEPPWWLLSRKNPSKCSENKKSSWRHLHRVTPLTCRLQKDLEAQKAEDVNKKEDARWTLTHCFLANMGGIHYQCDSSQFPLTALQIAKENHGFLNKPDLTKEDIEDQSKTDWFAKIVAALQFLQLVLSLIVRKTQGIASSQLEIVTVGFAVCGFVIYLAYFHKPQGVRTWPMTIKQPDDPDSSHVQYKKTFDSFWDVLKNERKTVDNSTHTMIDRIPNDNIPISQNRWAPPSVFLLALASASFGAIHVIAWKFEFPSTTENILWHLATIVSAASPVVGLLTIPIAQLTVSSGDAHAFLVNCLHLLREFSWHTGNTSAVNEACKSLEEIYKPHTGTKVAQRPYKDIFSGSNGESPQLAHELLDFLKKIDDPAKKALIHISEGFELDFSNLVELMEEKGSKRLNETAKTNLFPRRIWLPEWVNHVILYSTGLCYLFARLLLLAIWFSSLRRMPTSVYLNTPWTAYIPNIGSG